MIFISRASVIHAAWSFIDKVFLLILQFSKLVQASFFSVDKIREREALKCITLPWKVTLCLCTLRWLTTHVWESQRRSFRTCYTVSSAGGWQGSVEVSSRWELRSKRVLASEERFERFIKHINGSFFERFLWDSLELVQKILALHACSGLLNYITWYIFSIWHFRFDIFDFIHRGEKEFIFPCDASEGIILKWLRFIIVGRRQMPGIHNMHE